MEALVRNIPVVVGSFVAFVLYVAVGPALSIYGAQPNFIFAFCVLLAIVRPQNSTLVATLILGLLAGLVGNSPVGLMAVVLLVICFVLVRVFSVVDNGSLFMQVLSLVVAVLLCEFAYAFALTLFGLHLSFLSLFLYRVLPCAALDFCAGLILLPLMAKFMGASKTRGSVTALQFR